MNYCFLFGFKVISIYYTLQFLESADCNHYNYKSIYYSTLSIAAFGKHRTSLRSGGWNSFLSLFMKPAVLLFSLECFVLLESMGDQGGSLTPLIWYHETATLCKPQSNINQRAPHLFGFDHGRLTSILMSRPPAGGRCCGVIFPDLNETSTLRIDEHQPPNNRHGGTEMHHGLNSQYMSQ